MRRHTKELIRLLTPLNPKLGAEIGVWAGANSMVLLDSFPDLKLILIDNYCFGSWDTNKNYTNESVKAAKQLAVERFERFGDRVAWKFVTSLEAAKEIPDGSLDFAFIDADHRYEPVKADIAAYWPKIKDGGLLAGHDYSRHFRGIIRAVTEAFGDDVELSKVKSRMWWKWR